MYVVPVKNDWSRQNNSRVHIDDGLVDLVPDLDVGIDAVGRADVLIQGLAEGIA